MKIKNLKYIFGVAFGMVLFFSGVSFGSNCCNSEYTENTSVCDIPDESHCQGSTEWYNNNPGYDTPPNLDWFLAVINEHWDVCDGQDVRKIQEKLNQIGGSCITCVDGKAGYHTRSLMSSCVSYACSSPKVVPNFENGELVCNAGYKAQTENGITCCVKMTINGPSFEQQSREDNDILTVHVTFSVESPGLTEGSLHCDSNKFNIDGGTLSEISADSYSPGETNVGCVLEISTPDSYEVTLTVNDGVVKMGDNESSNGSDTFTRDEPEPESEPESEPEQEPEPECPNPPDGDGNCALGYQNNAGCCESKCSGDKIYDPSIDNCTGCALGTIPNVDNTKCMCNPNAKCCGIQLNTVVPFIGDCIEMGTDSGRGDTTSVTSVTAFPILMQGLMKILMSVIMVFSFIMVIVSGLMMTAGAFKSSSFDKGKTILKNVLISLILLGCSGLILSLINPSFFGG